MRDRKPTPGAAKLYAFRKRMKLTQAAAAQQLNCSGPSFNDWENGKKRPTADRRADIEQWTGGEVTQADWLRPGEIREVPVAVPGTPKPEAA